MKGSLWSSFIISETAFRWFVRVFALIYGARFAWEAFARDPQDETFGQAERRSTFKRNADRVILFFSAVALLLVAFGVLR